MTDVFVRVAEYGKFERLYWRGHMELVMWIAVGILASLGFIVLMPVLVVGTWFVVITVILGLADGAFWLLDQRWKKNGKRPVLVECLPQGT